MARINIDDPFWVEILSVVAALGDQDRAIGQVLRFFRMAQEKHKKGKFITEEEFKRAGFSEAIIGPFADRVEGGIQAVGAQKHFGWLTKRVEAGRAGGVASSKTKQKEAKPSKRKQAEPSYSSSYSSSSSPSPSLLVPTEPTAGGAEESEIYGDPPALTRAFIAAYCERFKARWNTNPPIHGKDSGIAGRLAKSLSFAKRDLYLDAFFSMPDGYLVKAKHPLSLFELKLNEISVFANSGEFHTSRQVREADDMATNALLLQRVREGKV